MATSSRVYSTIECEYSPEPGGSSLFSMREMQLGSQQ